MQIFFIIYILFCSSLYGQEIVEEATAELEVVALKTPKQLSDIATDVEVITKEDIQNSGATFVAEILRSKGIVAMDTTSREKGAGIYIRGLDVNYLLVVVDGQRVREGSSVIENMTLASIETIEIIKGPSSYLWGSDAMAGVIYIQTKRGSKKDGVHGNLGVSYANNFKFADDNHIVRPYLDLSYRTNGMGFFAGGSFDYGYDWISPLDRNGKPNERRDRGNFNVYGGTDLEFANIHELDLNVSYDQYIDPLTDPETNYNGNKTVKHPGRLLLANIGYKVYPTDKLDIRIHSGVNYDESHRYFSFRPGHDDKETFIANNTDLTTIYSINDSHVIKSGYTFDFQRRSQIRKNEVDNQHYNSLHHAFFVGYDYAYKGIVDIDLTLGGRYQFNDRYASLGKGLGKVTDILKASHSFSPEFGIVLKPHHTVAIKGHVGHSFKTPDLELSMMGEHNYKGGGSMDFVSYGNPNLLHEQSWGYSGTIEYNPISEMFLSFGIYRNDIWDLVGKRPLGTIYTDPDTGLTYDEKKYDNIGRAYTWGISSSIASAVDIPVFGTLSGGLNFEYVVAREIRTDGTGVFVDENNNNIENPFLDNRPPIVITGSLGWSKKEWGTSILFSGYYFHSMYDYKTIKVNGETASQLRRTGNQTTFDIKLAQKVNFGTAASKTPLYATIYFDMKNLLNASFDSDFDGDTDQPERSFVLGFNMGF